MQEIFDNLTCISRTPVYSEDNSPAYLKSVNPNDQFQLIMIWVYLLTECNLLQNMMDDSRFVMLQVFL
jgi:hypothetical protein